MKSKNIKAENGLIIDLEDERLIPDLFGEYDGNLVRIEKTLGVNIRGRGKIIEVSGEKSEFAESVIKDLYLQLTKGHRIGIEEVESASSIMKRFGSGSMSHGALSKEAHETLAIGMNRIKGASCSGEGGEDERRFTLLENKDSANSRVKQIASARFGVTINYLNNCNEIEIKIAQGAKPGEGGQLPGFKVTDEIAKLRYSTPGVTLISPPPHHDI